MEAQMKRPSASTLGLSCFAQALRICRDQSPVPGHNAVRPNSYSDFATKFQPVVLAGEKARQRLLTGGEASTMIPTGPLRDHPATHARAAGTYKKQNDAVYP